MKTSLLPLGLIATASLTAASAAEPDLSKLPPPASQTGLTFAKDIRPLFEASCLSCHGERRQRAGLRLDSLEAALQGSDEIKVIIPGDSKNSPLVHAVAQIDDETAMPPRRQRGGFGGGPGGGGPGGGGPGGGGPGGGGPGGGGPGGGGPGNVRPGGGPGGAAAGGGGRGPGGFGRGGGIGGALATPMFTQADSNADQKLTAAEFTHLGDTWFDKLDPEKAGQLTQDQFSQRLEALLPPAPEQPGGRPGGGGRGPGGQRGGNEGMGFSTGRFVGGGIFSAADADKDKAVTRAELKGVFAKWYAEMDSDKSGALDIEKFRGGVAAALMRSGGADGGRGRGPGGPGGFGGGGFGMFGRQALAQQILTQGDADKNGKLSKGEFTALADLWFTKLDPKGTGQVTAEAFTANLTEALGLPKPEGDATGAAERPGRPSPASPEAGGRAAADGRDGGRPGRGEAGDAPRGGGMGGAAGLAPGLFTAADTDKNGTLTLTELKATFVKWSTDFDSGKSGSLDIDQLYAGLREVLPQGFGGFGGGFGGGRGDGPAPKALTAEQVGLVRAWIDQGAH